MPRGSRIPFLIMLAAAAIPSGVAAQSNVVTPSPAPREGTVGPEQLRDFSLPGTRTQEPAQSDAAPPPPAERDPSQSPQPSTNQGDTARTPAASPDRPRSTVTAPVTTSRPAPNQPNRPTSPAQSVTLGLQPPADTPIAGAAEPSFTPTFTQPPLPDPATAEDPSFAAADPADGPSPLGWLPWLLAALVTAGAAWFLVRRQREQHAGGDLAFAGAGLPSPAPPTAPLPPRAAPAPPVRAPAPAARPTPAPPSRPAGIVSTRLRPWIEIDMVAERAAVTEDEAIIHFELLITNSGSAPARNLVVEAIPLNAGDTQDQEIASFYERPDGDGGGIEIVPPLGQIALRNMVRMPRASIREYEVEGRRLLVPVVAFNAGYRWSGGSGRSSAAFLVGRGGEDTEKMGPLRLDLGPREFRGLTRRRLDPAVRR
ncbi:hypothetical protein ACFQPG_03865 [Sphingomonas sp. GCM10030256]|uniref:hypothetical protein n=1 Tax=Sphingomonas sp. GCM10030256 TaxID=3273427 RepID=UPI003611D59C